LSLIKSKFDQELSELRRALSDDVIKQFNHYEPNSSCNTSISSITSFSTATTFNTTIDSVLSKRKSKSIKPLSKWNEAISNDDKFSEIIDDVKSAEQQQQQQNAVVAMMMMNEEEGVSTMKNMSQE
jgi:hypothetical protein